MVSPSGSAPGRYGSRRPRGALALALLLHGIIIALLILQKAAPIRTMAPQGLTTIALPAASEEAEKQEAQARTESVKAAQTEVADQAPPPELPPPPPVPTPQETKPFQWLQLSSAELAASDIGRMRSAQPAAAADSGADSRAAAGPGNGSGPGGATLYPADWYREPSSTELGGYLRPGQPRSGWGQIACRTVAQFRVEDCYIIGEFPRGSGFARSVLDASWQFLVLPPRINGKAQVGTWVSIRITYTPEGGAGPG
jgi:protein TonB